MSINRHHIIIVVCIVLVIAAGIVAGHSIKKHEDANNARVAQQNAINASKEQAAQKKHADAVTSENTTVKAECSKETQYYNLLSTAQKKTVVAPNCATVAITE